MEQNIQSQTIDKNLLEQDLPQILAQQYIIEWVLPHSFNDHNYLATKYKKLTEEYQKHEANLQELKNQPIASVMGGINYSMTLDEMLEKLQNKFLHLKQNNQIISQEEFENIKDGYFDLPHTDLTRIWGAEYLKEKIQQSSYLRTKYDVPDFVIVLNDSNELTINISFYTRLFPIPLELLNGHIYFKKIHGQPLAARSNSTLAHDIGTISGIGFDDFKTGNLIQDTQSGIIYIIDTEFRSFKLPISAQLESLLNYAAERFLYLNNISEYTYKLSLYPPLNP